MAQDYFDEAKPMDEYTEEERHRDDPAPDDEAQKAAEAEWMHQQAMEMFARMEYRRERDRMHEEEYNERMRRHGYSRFNSPYYYRGSRYDMSPEDEEALREALPQGIGILAGLLLGVGCGASELGTYLILAALGFYLGLFFKHHTQDGTTAVEAFRETRPGLFIALGLVIVGLISYFKPLI